MTTSPKIQTQHWQRQAFVYIRQSTLRQVAENLESQALQYQLVQRAQTLGWRVDQIVVIDDDLGKSGISTDQRSGFQTLAAAVGLGQVGAILVTDVSRLARNCADWYQLLDLASHCDALIIDTSGVYDPRRYDDRLLLGLKGTFSEIQWHQMRQQLKTARDNKARRGELHLRLPVGLVRLDDGRVIKTPDQQVQDALQLVFTQFEHLGSVGKVLRWLRDQAIQLPRQEAAHIRWVRPSYYVIYQFLKNPAYAGAYTYGRTQRQHLPGQIGTVVTKQVPLAEWPVVIRAAFPAYIAWAQFLANQERLRANARGASWTIPPPRQGSALLPGLVLCGRCGRSMHVHYTHSPAYICDFETRTFAAPRCQNFTIHHIDPVISALVLAAVQPAHLQAARLAQDQLAAEHQAVIHQWQQRRERAAYQVHLAQSRYETVDPTNRLVAAELERLWEQQLQVQAQLEQDWQTFQAAHQAQAANPVDFDSLFSLAEQFPRVWQASSTSQTDRKRLLRCLIRDVTLDSVSQPGFSCIHVRWHTGAVTSVTVPRPGQGPPRAEPVIQRLTTLAQEHTDECIATLLNQQNFPTATGLPWTRARVYAVRRKHQIPSACPASSSQNTPRGDGLVRSGLVARQLQVHHSMISQWFKKGLLTGYQEKPRSPLWIYFDAAVQQRLSGDHPLTPDMLPLQQAAQLLNLTPAQICDTLKSGDLIAFRIAQNDSLRWFVRWADHSLCPDTL